MRRSVAGLLGISLGIFCLLSVAAPARAYTRKALTQYEAGQEYQANEQWQQAEDAYQAALKADPSLVVAYKALGSAAYLSGDRPGALRYYDVYLKSYPRDSATRKFVEELRASLALESPDAPRSEIVKTDGEVLSGMIEEYKRGESVRIRTQDGTVFEVDWDDIKEINGESVAPPRPPDQAPRQFWQKGWYLDLIDLGFTELSYPAATAQSIREIRAAYGGGSGGQLSLNYLGFYWPVGARRNLLLGFTINALADPVVDGGAEQESWQLNQYIYAFSSLYFPFGRIGDGLYVVGNVGPAAAVQDGYSASGLGLLAGGGYMIPLGNSVRPRVELAYSVKSLSSGSPYFASGIYQALSLDFGLMW